jgi:formyl-CoA transferase
VVAGFPVEVHPVVGPYHVIPPPTRFDATPASVRRPAPLIGQDGDEVLAEVGYTADEIAALREADVLRSR